MAPTKTIFDRVGWLITASLLALVVATIVFSILAMMRAPFLSAGESTDGLRAIIGNITHIDDIPLSELSANQLPLFFKKTDENLWWVEHKKINELMSNGNSVLIKHDLAGYNHNPVVAEIRYLSVSDAIKRLLPIISIALGFTVAAIFVASRGASSQEKVLTAFLMFCAVYLSSAAPLVNRELTLNFQDLTYLVNIHYIANAGLITFVHYALVFPKPKQFLRRRHFSLTYLLYVYMFSIILLYLLDITSFGVTDPLMFIWIAISISAFIHSIYCEKDRLLRNQIVLTLSAPILVVALYAVINISPALLGRGPESFTNFAMLSLVLAFALPAALDNARLHRFRISHERTIKTQNSQLRSDLHDNTLREMANISALSGTSMKMLRSDQQELREKLGIIRELAGGYSNQARKIIQLTDSQSMNWTEFFSFLRQSGYELTSHTNIEFILESTEDPLFTQVPGPLTKVNLFKLFAEAVVNSVRHSQASIIRVEIDVQVDGLRLSIIDNGIGIDSDKTPDGHFGIANMKKQMQDIKGTFDIVRINSSQNCVIATVPIYSD